jgi:AbrB family looped-hinge helix DNA binding protein
MDGIQNLFVTAAVTGKRQITIPKEVTERLDINVGDIVIFRVKNGAIVFEKYEPSVVYGLTVNNSLKVNFYMSFDSISDALAMDDLYLFEEIFEFNKDVINKGGRAIIQREYVNSNPEIMGVIDSLEELSSVEEKLLATAQKLCRRCCCHQLLKNNSKIKKGAPFQAKVAENELL